MLNRPCLKIFGGCRNEYANFFEIKTQTITMEREKDGQQKKAKLIIRLVKHDNFDANIEKFEQIKKENDTALGARKAAAATAEPATEK